MNGCQPGGPGWDWLWRDLTTAGISLAILVGTLTALHFFYRKWK